MASAVRRIEDERRGRFYDIEGKLYPSVTNILGAISKPALVGWAAKTERAMVLQAAARLYEDIAGTPRMNTPAYLATLTKRLGTEKAHTKELAKAGEIGSQVHAMIEWNERKALGQVVGPQPTIGPQATWAFSTYETWRSQAGLTPRMIEQTVWSNEHGYAGTMDLAGTVQSFGSAMAVTDWKSGKSIYVEALLQSAAYVHALCEMGHAPMGETYGMVVRFPKVQGDPDFEVRVIPPAEITEYFDAFLHVKAVWEFVQKHDKWLGSTN
jgi:hypothetical protein